MLFIQMILIALLLIASFYLLFFAFFVLNNLGLFQTVEMAKS